MQTRFDNSLLSTTYCTTRALLRHVHGLTTERDEQRTLAGRAAHSALALYFKTRDGEAAEACFATEYETVAPKDESDRLSFENTSAILGQWLDSHPLELLPFEVLPELVEVPFQLKLEEGFEFTGRIDAIARARDTGKLVVVDHKTTGKIDASQYRNDSQMSGYVWAAKQTGHEVSGVYIDAIEFSLLPGMKGNGHYKCRVHRRTDANGRERASVYDECRLEHCKFELSLKSRTPEQLEAWRLTALSMARRFVEMSTKYPKLEDVAAAPMEGTFYFQGCRYCPFGDFCASGRPVQWAESMLLYRPWSPLE